MPQAPQTPRQLAARRLARIKTGVVVASAAALAAIGGAVATSGGDVSGGATDVRGTAPVATGGVVDAPQQVAQDGAQQFDPTQQTAQDPFFAQDPSGT